MSGETGSGHPNDPQEVRRGLELDARLLSERERSELRARLDAALARLRLRKRRRAV